jgi:hypothetical protein
MRDVVHFITAAVAAVAGMALLSSIWASSAVKQFEINQLLTAGRTAAWVAAQEEVLDDPPEDLAQNYFQRLAEEPLIDEAFLLKKAKVSLHSDPEQAGRRLDRESLADKALFDAYRDIKSDVRKNLEEREKKPELNFDPYPEARTTRRGGELSVQVPMKVDGEYEAMVQVTGRPEPLDLGYPFGIFLYLVVAVGAFAAASRVLADRPRLFVGGLLVGLFALFGTLGPVASWRADARDTAMDREAALLARLGEKGLLAATPAHDRAKLVDVLARDIRGRTTVDLVDVRSSTVAATVAGDVRTDGPVAVAYVADYRASMLAKDRAALLPWALAFMTIAIGLFVLGHLGQTGRAIGSVVEHRRAYGYLSPAMLGLAVLVFIPVTYGIVLGFMKRIYNEFQFVGLENYVTILSDPKISDPQNFYFTTGVTIMWTVLNVALHVRIGLFFALHAERSDAQGPRRVRVLLDRPLGRAQLHHRAHLEADVPQASSAR